MWVVVTYCGDEAEDVFGIFETDEHAEQWAEAYSEKHKPHGRHGVARSLRPVPNLMMKWRPVPSELRVIEREE